MSVYFQKKYAKGNTEGHLFQHWPSQTFWLIEFSFSLLRTDWHPHSASSCGGGNSSHEEALWTARMSATTRSPAEQSNLHLHRCELAPNIRWAAVLWVPGDPVSRLKSGSVSLTAWVWIWDLNLLAVKCRASCLTSRRLSSFICKMSNSTSLFGLLWALMIRSVPGTHKCCRYSED